MVGLPEKSIYDCDYRRTSISELLDFPASRHLQNVEVLALPQGAAAIQNHGFVFYVQGLDSRGKENLWVRGMGSQDVCAEYATFLKTLAYVEKPIVLQGMYLACPTASGLQSDMSAMPTQDTVWFLNRIFAPGELRLAGIEIGKRRYGGLTVDESLVLPHYRSFED